MLIFKEASDCTSVLLHAQEGVQPSFLSWQVVHLQTLVLWVQLQMKDVLVCRTVLSSQVVLCATVVSPLGPLLSMSATPLIVWRVKV